MQVRAADRCPRYFEDYIVGVGDVWNRRVYQADVARPVPRERLHGRPVASGLVLHIDDGRGIADILWTRLQLRKSGVYSEKITSDNLFDKACMAILEK